MASNPLDYGVHERETTLVDIESPQQSPQSSKFDKTPLVIPPEHPYRTLVLCFDGTGDQFDADNSNVVQFFTMLKKDDSTQQMVYYQAGIGTYVTPQIATPLWSNFSKRLDEAIAWNLDAHVMDGYEFLMQNYKIGDRICLLGFSRGAYTARGLAGMIHKVGVLPPCNHQNVPFAYKMYTRTDETGWKQSNAFKKAFSIDVDIEFIGVWDTVSSVGLIPKRLPFSTSNTIVRTFRHAVSLDERRTKFKANHWNRPTKSEEVLGIHCHHADRFHHDHNEERKNHSQRALERKYSKDPTSKTNIKEVWFSGCHCDVGGGSHADDVTFSLARIPLRWMIRECFKTNSGIMFNADLLREIGLNPHSIWPEVLKRPPPLPVDGFYIENVSKTPEVLPDGIPPFMTEEEVERRDALSPIYDQLSLNPIWWILEVIPMKQRYQRDDNSWVKVTRANWGGGREPRHGTVKIHRSVKMRMDAETKDGVAYKPKAVIDHGHNTEWVD